MPTSPFVFYNQDNDSKERSKELMDHLDTMKRPNNNHYRVGRGARSKGPAIANRKGVAPHIRKHTNTTG